MGERPGTRSDVTFDGVASAFESEIYGSSKGYVRLEVLWSDLLGATMSEVMRQGETGRLSVQEFRLGVLSRSGTERLAAHLEGTYAIHVTALIELDLGVFRVDRQDGPSWVARVFSSLRPIEQVAADAEVLRRLEAGGFPAERCAVADPVSRLDGQAVLVTAFVAGEHARHGPKTLAMLGGLLGRLAAHPVRDPALTRPAGSWHHLSPGGGGRGRDIETLIAYLGELERAADPHDRRLLGAISDEVNRIDDAASLPSAFIHPDLTPPNVIMGAAGPVVIDWTGAGTGPRIFPLGFLLSVAGTAGPTLIDAVVAGYRPHVRLNPEELALLPNAVRAPSLIIEAWTVVVGRARPAEVAAELSTRQAMAERIATRAQGLFDV